jgi:hypothetical protein
VKTWEGTVMALLEVLYPVFSGELRYNIKALVLL